MIPGKSRRTCFVLYRLTPWTLPVLLAARMFHDETWFVLCSQRMARWFGPFLLRHDFRQLTEHDYFNRGTFDDGNKNGVAIGERLAARHGPLVRAFRDMGGHAGYGDMVAQSFSEAWAEVGYINAFIVRFLTERSGDFGAITLWGREAAIAELWPEPFPRNVRAVPGVAGLAFLAGAAGRLTAACLVAILPYLSLAQALRKGVRLTWRRKLVARTRRILFLHRYTDRAERNPFRDMYFIQSGIVDANACINTPMATSARFSPDKRTYLEGKGGEILESRDLRLSVGQALRMVSIDHVAVLVAGVRAAGSGRGAGFRFFRYLLENAHLLMMARLLLEQAGADTVFIESDTASICRAIAVEARRQEVRSVSLIHGAAGQAYIHYVRARSYLDYYIVQGEGYEALKAISPNVRCFYPAGNFELADSGAPAPNVLPAPVRQNRKDFIVVAFFVNLNTNITPTHSAWSKSAYIDRPKVARFCESLLGPLFRWIADNRNVYLIWRTKPGVADGRIDHPFIAPLLAGIPRERIIKDDEHSLGDLASLSDVCVASTLSSAMSTSVLSMRPTVGVDLFFDGADSRYHPKMAAQSGQEVVENVIYFTEHGMPCENFDRFRMDWHGKDSLNVPSMRRIQTLFDNLLKTPELYPSI